MLSFNELEIIALSLQVALVGTLIGLPIALAAGWVLAKASIPGKALIDTLLSFPLVLPPVVTGYLLLILLGRNGPIGSLLHSWFGVDVVFTWVAAALAAGLVSLPLMLRTFEVAMASVDPRLELASRTLGAGPLKTFFSVTVPLARRGIAAGVLLAFARAVGEFGATIVVAGNTPGRTQTIPLAIFNRVETGDDAAAVRLITISLLIAFAALLLHRRLVRQQAF